MFDFVLEIVSRVIKYFSSFTYLGTFSYIQGWCVSFYSPINPYKNVIFLFYPKFHGLNDLYTILSYKNVKCCIIFYHLWSYQTKFKGRSFQTNMLLFVVLPTKKIGSKMNPYPKFVSSSSHIEKALSDKREMIAFYIGDIRKWAWGWVTVFERGFFFSNFETRIRRTRVNCTYFYMVVIPTWTANRKNSLFIDNSSMIVRKTSL